MIDVLSHDYMTITQFLKIFFLVTISNPELSAICLKKDYYTSNINYKICYLHSVQFGGVINCYVS